MSLRALEQLVRKARSLPARPVRMPTLREMSPRFQRLVWLAKKERRSA